MATKAPYIHVMNAPVSDLLNVLSMKANDWCVQGIEVAQHVYSSCECTQGDMLRSITACTASRTRAIELIKELTSLLTTSEIV